ncbi:MAG: cupredoxin domain-containing protein [Gammaproteobacteria bacterium]|nr:cupredoxin domain-containing protein [Gammaproteobacteria bacterium]
MDMSKHDHSKHHHHGMQMDMTSMVMNENRNTLPPGCTEISETVDITVKAGREYASKTSGIMFGYDQGQWKVKPCSRVNVTFVNKDHVRHQFMLHELPPSVYPPFGMFNIELTGPGQKQATFITPNENRTFLVHCDVAQHTENGLKAQLVVGEGSEEDLPSIPGVTPPNWFDRYDLTWDAMSYSVLALSVLGTMLFVVGSWLGIRRLLQS